MYWARISAEDGFPPGIYNLGMSLNDDDSDPLNRVRARYWLKLAKVRGVRLADFGLCLVNRKDDPALPVCQLPPGTVEIH
jgi:TPR repeat protein